MSRMTFLEVTSCAKSHLEKGLSELGLSADLIDEFTGHHTLVNYSKGAVVFRQGSPADVLFYVLTGLLKVYCPRPDGTRIMVNIAGPGDFVGYVDYLDSRGHLAQVFEVEALTRSSVALFTREHILKILNALDRPALLRAIEQLNTAWSSMAHWFGSFLGMSFKERLELVLKDLAVRFGARDTRGILLTPELAHADFADMIGSSRPMVTRLMAEMTNEGLLSRQGKRFVLREPLADDHVGTREKNHTTALSPPSGPLNSLLQNNWRAI
jgi:CRP/FNR family transcriptional regulator, cyclic AMP receptor protein